jgi:hypothetical protein
MMHLSTIPKENASRHLRIIGPSFPIPFTSIKHRVACLSYTSTSRATFVCSPHRWPTNRPSRPPLFISSHAVRLSADAPLQPKFLEAFASIGIALAVHQPGRIKDIEVRDGEDHERAIQGDEILLVCDQVAGPALQQLDAAIHASDEDGHDAQTCGADQQLQIPRKDLVTGVLLWGAVDTEQEDDGEDGEDGDGGHLEEDTGHHDVGAELGVAVGRGGGVGCKTATYGLEDEGDEVAGAKDPEVPFGRDGRSVGALEGDEPAKDDVDACREEGGCWSSDQLGWWSWLNEGKGGESTDDESGDLHEKGIVVVRADGTPCTASPSDDFSYGADCEDLCRWCWHFWCLSSRW